MKISIKRIFWLMALPMLLGLASCVDKDNAVTGKEIAQTEEMPDVTQPTDDQMAVKVTADVPTAVLGTFDEGSTGAALVKRLPVVTDHIGPETKMVLVPGTMFNDASMTADDLDALVRLSLEGGFLAIERPTGQQMLNFAVLYAAKLVEMQQQLYEETFDLSSETAAAAAARSKALERFQTRQANIREMAQTRAGGDDLNAVMAEMVIYGPTAYFMQEPFNEEHTTYIYTEDSEGNTTEAQPVTTKQERTAYISGTLADAAADWLNANVTDDQQPEQNAPRRAMTRAGGDAINEIMDASEEFTYNEAIDWRSWKNETLHFTNRVNMIVRSWGVHNMESNKDYYYLKQNVTLRMGDENGWKIFFPRKDEYTWTGATNYGDYGYWYGSFLSQYVTSMNLTGSGSIKLEAAKPDTDNNTSSTSVSAGSSSSKTETLGMTWGGTASASPGFNIGGNYSEGTTNGTSFSLSASQTSKDFGATKNTSGTQVTWTYKGNLPKYYMEEDTHKYYYKHQTAADILTNDCDVANEICWSVANPSGRYTFNITSQPQTAALLFSYKKVSAGNSPSKYEYATTASSNHSQELLQPNRAMQKWRMSINVEEWAGAEVAGAKEYLQDAVRKQFSDIYADVFTIADKSAESLDAISAIINYSKKVFGKNMDVLSSIAKSKGVQKFSIHWRNDEGVQAKDPFVVDTGSIASVLWCKNNSTLYFVKASADETTTWDGQTITKVWSGSDVTDAPKYGPPAWNDSELFTSKDVSRVVIDKSFADVCPKRMSLWFAHMSNATFEGIENLNTSEATSLQSMFSQCTTLTTINVDGFDVSKVTDVSTMFDECSNLTTIYCNQKWNDHWANGYCMFYGCTKLTGAVSFDDSKFGWPMANPTTGYFTSFTPQEQMEDHETSVNVYIKDAQDNSENLKKYVGQYVNIRYSRSLQAKVGSNGDYTPTPYTVCLPYDLDLTSAINSGQAAVYTLAAVTGGQFVFKKVNKTVLTAGTPYVIMVNRDKISLSAKGVKIVTAEPGSSKVYTSVSDWQNATGKSIGDWMGTFDLWDADEAAAWDAFALMPSDGRWDYYNATSTTASIPAFRAFLSSSSIEQKAYKAKYED